MLHGRVNRTAVPFAPHSGVRRTVLAVALALAALAAPTPALARGGGDDVRIAASCGRGASAELRLKADHGAIEVEYRVRRDRSERWSVVVVHERRVDWRGSASTHGSGFRVRRTIPNFAGADEVTVRASSPRGLTCQASAVLSAS